MMPIKYWNMTTIHCYFDGACEPRNPGGNMGMGACAITPDGELLFEYAQFVPAHVNNSNNVAEYRALVHVLEWLIQQGYDKDPDISIIIFGDSMLVVEQIMQRWKMRGGRYMQYAQKAIVLMMQFSKRPTLKWIPREQNDYADKLSKREMIKNNVEFKLQRP